MASPLESLINHVDVNDEAKDNNHFGYAMQLASSIVLPMSLYSAIELGVFEVIAKAGPDAKLSASDIAAKLSAKNPDAPLMLDRILRLLASHHVLDCSVDGWQRYYSLASVAKYFVPNQDGVSLGPLLVLGLDKVYLQCWPHLKDAILEGGLPFERAYGVHIFDYPDLDPRFNQIFNAAMHNHSTIVMKHMLEAYKGFENLKQLVDVGGGLGQAIKAITSKYPQIKGINYDLPHVIEHAPPYPGVEHVGGDMFESVPKGDAIFMKWVLHDWSDDHCLKLLKNCHEALPNDGKVIVMDGVLPIMPNTSPDGKYISQMHVFMLAANSGGKERTEHEFRALATAAGFRGIKYECLVLNFWVMEFFK